MQNNIKIELKQATVDNLEAFSEILKKDASMIIEEALEVYFEETQQRLMGKNSNDESAMTNLDFDEFWDDMEI